MVHFDPSSFQKEKSWEMKKIQLKGSFVVLDVTKNTRAATTSNRSPGIKEIIDVVRHVQRRTCWVNGRSSYWMWIEGLRDQIST